MPRLQGPSLEVSEQTRLTGVYAALLLILINFFIFLYSIVTSGLDQFGDTILFTTDDEILEAMSRYDDTFLSEVEGPESLVYEEELQRPRTADGEGEERPFTQAGFREEDLTVSTICNCSDYRFSSFLLHRRIVNLMLSTCFIS